MIGFCADVDVGVDLSLSTDDAGSCMLCAGQRVMLGIISTPCGCPQPLCLPHYERERPRWSPGDPIFCHMCKPWDELGEGRFVRWEKP